MVNNHWRVGPDWKSWSRVDAVYTGSVVLYGLKLVLDFCGFHNINFMHTFWWKSYCLSSLHILHQCKSIHLCISKDICVCGKNVIIWNLLQVYCGLYPEKENVFMCIVTLILTLGYVISLIKGRKNSPIAASWNN